MKRWRNCAAMVLSVAGGLVLLLTLLAALGGRADSAQARAPVLQTERRVCASGCVYTNVQSAVDAAIPGDVIRIATGVYTGVLTRNEIQQLAFITKSLTLRGGYNADFSAWDPKLYTTTLDAEGDGRVLVIDGAHTVAVEGLRLINGRGIYRASYSCDPYGIDPDPAGGAVYIRLATVTLSATEVLSSAAGTRTNEQGCGGGIYAQDAALTLVHSTIQGNAGSKDNGHYSMGGGVFISRGSAHIAGNHFLRNSATTCYGGGDGGGVLSYNAALTLEDNLFEHNDAVSNGGAGNISGAPATVQIRHNRFISNTSGYWGGGLVVAGGTVEGNLFLDNTTASQGGGMTLRPGIIRVINNVFLDNATDYSGSAVLMSRSMNASVAAYFTHNTFNHNTGPGAAAVEVCSGCTLLMTNTLFTNQGIGVLWKTGANVRLNTTLWDNTITPTVGAIVVTNDITGVAALDADGYHLTAASAAVDAGVATGIQADFEGDFRPRGQAPDVGADESPFSGQPLAPGIQLEKAAAQPRWVIRPLEDGGGYLEQVYYLRFLYGPGGITPPVQTFTLTDQLPVSLTLAAESHAEGIDFVQAGGALEWRSAAALLPGEWTWAQLHTRAEQSAGALFRNEAEVRYQFLPTETLALTTAVESSMPVLPPLILEPGDGETCPGEILVKGMAQPGVEATLWRDGVVVTTRTVGASGVFTMLTDVGYGPIATTTLTMTASLNNQVSPASRPVVLTPGEAIWCPQRSALIHTNASGHETTFRFRGPDGRFSSDKWSMTGSIGAYKLALRACNCPGTPLPPWIMRIRIGTIIFIDPDGPATGDVWEFDIGGLAGSGLSLTIEWQCDGDNDWHGRGGGVINLIDPDGYVFDITQGYNPLHPTDNTLTGITVTAYMSVPEWGGWIPWPAHLYNQTNPQSTSPEVSDGVTTTGYFAFFTPPGSYYLQTEGRGDEYQPWRSPVVQVITDIVHVNVPLTPRSASAGEQIVVGPGIALPAQVTLPAGGVVEWVTSLEGPMTEVVRWMETPILRVLSARDPLSDTLGFDSGLLAPGRSYRRQFDTAGVYAYSDGLGHSGAIIVTGGGMKVYLPLVLKHP